MAEYRTPLPRLFAGMLEASLEKVLALDPESAQRLLRLQGKCLQLDLEGLEITLFITFESGNLRVDLDCGQEPDTVISASPVALFGMAAPADGGDWGLPGSSVNISGDANLARDLERIFSRLEPDWQRPLSVLFGETLGYQVASGLRQGADALRKAAGDSAQMAGDWLREDSDLLARPEQLREFSKTVDTLSDAADRLQARINLLRERQQ
ncbi:MAG: SCP2 domain-containing protein [Xanthomonadales bacterium]|nr:SCP2 domain-containing protein [Xanthomonadales bacterium]